VTRQALRMNAMVLERAPGALCLREVAVPEPSRGQILVSAAACGVCRTDVHLVDGELEHPKLPLIPGHQIVGRVAALGEGVTRFRVGDRVGVPWLGYTDGTCRFCSRGDENLCDRAGFTGYTIDGGFAEYAVADQRYCFPIPERYGDLAAAPLLCAGLIGYRSFRLAGPAAQRLGFYGFGAAAHLLTQLAVHQGKEVYAFTRPGDERTQELARRLGAVWAGASTDVPPEKLDAAILFAPVGALVPLALRAVEKGGAVVAAGIHMSEIPAFPYEILWEERSVRSVANLTRRDGDEFLALAAEAGIEAEVEGYPLGQANEAIEAIRSGRLTGAAVLEIAGPR